MNISGHLRHPDNLPVAEAAGTTLSPVIDTPSKSNRTRGIAIIAAMVIVALALVGVSIETNPYDSGPVGAVKRHFSVSEAKFGFVDYSRRGSRSDEKCTSGPDLTEGERLIVTAANGEVMGTFRLEYKGGTPYNSLEPQCVYSADISSLPSGQRFYDFTIAPNPRVMISCSESQLERVTLRYWKKSQGGSCSDGETLSDESVRVAPPTD